MRHLPNSREKEGTNFCLWQDIDCGIVWAEDGHPDINVRKLSFSIKVLSD